MKQPYINSMLKRLYKPTYIKKVVNVYTYPGARFTKYDKLGQDIEDYKVYSKYPGPRQYKYNKKVDKDGDDLQRYPGARFNKNDIKMDDYDIEHILRNGGL